MEHEMQMKKVVYVCRISFLAGIMMIFCLLAGYSEQARSLSLSVTPGKNWETTMWMGVIPVKKTPQFAAWIESADGKFIKALTVTARSGRNEWRAAPGDGRPEALPVWNHAVAASGFSVDAASSATPKGGTSVTLTEEGLAAGTEYVVRLEVNTSFDYNDSWTKKAKKGESGYSGVNGQPSVVYEARFVSGKPVSVELKPVGQGSVDGTDGNTVPGLQGLTTALSIIGSASLDIK